MPVTIDYPAFDADNHYYEAIDALTRHQDPAMARRGAQWVDLDGKQRLLVGGAVHRFIPNPTFDPVAVPGCLDAYHRGEVDVTDVRDAFGELIPLPAECRERDARLRVMDEQGLGGAFLFPTLGVGLEEALVHDIEALQHVVSAFNRWLDDDWGFAHQERIFAVPMISLSDIDAAVDELDWALGRDARAVCLRMAPVLTEHGYRSLGDTEFDPFWARINEAGITVAFHTGDSGYTRFTDEWEPFGAFRSFQFTPFRLMTSDRPVFDTMAALVCHGVFDRFPNVRIMSVENGAGWVESLLARFHKVLKTQRHSFSSDPIEAFKRHVWVSPFHEEHIPEFVDLMGADRVLMGSDWPHAEGLADPVGFADELDGCSDEAIRLVMHDNARALATPLR